MSEGTQNTTHPHPRPYGLIFIGLFILTVLEITTANLHLPKIYIVLCLVGMAIVKATLVAMFYMHLRFEKSAARFCRAFPAYF